MGREGEEMERTEKIGGLIRFGNLEPGVNSAVEASSRALDFGALPMPAEILFGECQFSTQLDIMI